MPIVRKFFSSWDYGTEPGCRLSERVIDHYGKEKNNKLFSSLSVFPNISY